MNPKRFVSRDYEDVNVNNDGDNDTDIEITNSNDKFEDESVLSSTDVPFGANHKKHKGVVRCFVLPFLALALLSLVVSQYLRGSSTGAMIPNATTADEGETESSPQPFAANSPFFEHVLEWREVPLADVLSDYDSDNNSGAANATVTVNADPAASNHYKASIEFCSNPDKDLYGYGPVGNCVPGRAAPLIRMTPKRYVLFCVLSSRLNTRPRLV
jgi:hypothetical protein